MRVPGRGAAEEGKEGRRVTGSTVGATEAWRGGPLARQGRALTFL